MIWLNRAYFCIAGPIAFVILLAMGEFKDKKK